MQDAREDQEARKARVLQEQIEKDTEEFMQLIKKQKEKEQEEKLQEEERRKRQYENAKEVRLVSKCEVVGCRWRRMQNVKYRRREKWNWREKYSKHKNLKNKVDLRESGERK